jgi:hypothetical protein
MQVFFRFMILSTLIFLLIVPGTMAWDFYVGGQGGSIGCYDSIDHYNKNMCGTTVPISLRCESKGRARIRRIEFYAVRNFQLKRLPEKFWKVVCRRNKGESTYGYIRLAYDVPNLVLRVTAASSDGQRRVACIPYTNGRRSGSEYNC